MKIWYAIEDKHFNSLCEYLDAQAVITDDVIMHRQKNKQIKYVICLSMFTHIHLSWNN